MGSEVALGWLVPGTENEDQRFVEMALHVTSRGQTDGVREKRMVYLIDE
jgi:hypothetical protein